MENTNDTGTTVAETVKLVQASLSRLGEVSRGSPRPSRANGRLGDPLSFEQVSVSLRRGESRLSENVQRPLFQICELSPRRRELAWARVSRLGEAPQPERGVEQKCVSAWCSSCLLMVGLYFIVLLYDGMGEMNMHDWEGIICGELWAWHDFYMSCTWEVGYIYMCVWSQFWNEQQWTLMVGKPVAWYWYERKHFTHDW